MSTTLQQRDRLRERASPEQVQASARLVASSELLAAVLEAAGVGAMVLNRQRQILFANPELLELTEAGALEAILGSRPGEALGCVHARLDPAGCGAAEPCASCGAGEALFACERSGKPGAGEYRLVVCRERGTEALEFQVKVVPVTLEGEPLTVVTLRDIGGERRREILERVFFHDILNTITGLYGHVRLLEEVEGEESAKVLERVVFLCERLKREVADQRSLLEAEAGTLEPELKPVQPGDIVETIRAFFSGHVAVTRTQLELTVDADCPELVTDSALLTRVIINMVKNAFEATRAGDTIRLWVRADEGSCTFAVWNPGRIPDEVAARIFRRSFSTKGGRGRGLGTYSMKLLGERYLGGRVGFATSEEGTVFSITLPLRPADAAPDRP
jgi:PAS domain-containing protein